MVRPSLTYTVSPVENATWPRLFNESMPTWLFFESGMATGLPPSPKNTCLRCLRPLARFPLNANIPLLLITKSPSSVNSLLLYRNSPVLSAPREYPNSPLGRLPRKTICPLSLTAGEPRNVSKSSDVAAIRVVVVPSALKIPCPPPTRSARNNTIPCASRDGAK